MDGIKNGFFIIDSDAKCKSAYCKNYKSATSYPNKLKVEKQILSEIKANRYHVTNKKPLIVSALGAIPKGNSDELRLIHDCSRPLDRGINMYANPDSFSFNSVDTACDLIEQGYFMAKVDLKSAYRSVGIHPSQYVITGLQWQFEGTKSPVYLFDSRLMFGAAQAVGIFHRLSNSVVRMLERRKLPGKIVNYLDDFLVISPSLEECQYVTNVLLELLMELGFDINWEKVTTPSTVTTFLGIEIDSVDMFMYIPPEKLAQIKQKSLSWLTKCKATKRELQSLAGLLSWGAKCAKPLRPVLRSIINLYKGLKASWHHIRISAAVKYDVQCFVQWCDHFNGVSFSKKRRNLPIATVYTDSSLQSGAAYCNADFVYACWSADLPSLANTDIYVKEMAAILLAFIRWGSDWKGSHVIVNTDNYGALWAIQKGTSKNIIANSLLRHILWFAAINDISFDVIYIASSANIIADALSRLYDYRFFNRVVALLKSVGLNMCDVGFDLLKHMSCASFHYLLRRYSGEGTHVR